MWSKIGAVAATIAVVMGAIATLVSRQRQTDSDPDPPPPPMSSQTLSDSDNDEYWEEEDENENDEISFTDPLCALDLWPRHDRKNKVWDAMENYPRRYSK